MKTPYAFEPPSRPVGILLDTDMATDCDDAGAMAVLHTLTTAGEAEILAIVANNKDPASIGAVAAINAFYGRPNIPLGAYQEDAVGTDAAGFVRECAARADLYGHTIRTRTDAPPALDVYRRTLAAAPDHSVVIVSIGHLNNLAGLLESGPDAFSALSGRDLTARKTPHLVVMGGDYPSGKEHNFFARGSAAFTAKVIDDWPVPVLFTGFTLGERVMTGPQLANLPEMHPVRCAYAGYWSKPLEGGRPSWDQTAVLAAVRSPARYWQISPPGWNRIAADGSNSWEDAPKGKHAYLIEKVSPETVASEIGRLMRGDL